jgi:hypothetical protein
MAKLEEELRERQETLEKMTRTKVPIHPSVPTTD